MAAKPTSIGNNILIAVFLAALAVAVFAPALKYDFVNLDDDLYVYQNPAVLRGLSWQGVRYALTSGDAGTWAPLTWLSYELDTSLFGARPGSYHLTNILLHAAAGGLLFLALQSFLRRLWTSALVTVIFLFHPLRVESVAWIAERKDVLCAFFWCLGLFLYSRYAKEPTPGRWVLLFLCFVAGLMSKMTMAAFPFVLLLLDFWPLNRWGSGWPNLPKAGPLVREKAWFFLAALIAVWFNSQALRSVHTLAPVGADWSVKLLRIPGNYLFYLRKILWPSSLSVLYPIPEVHAGAALVNLLLLGAITILVLRQTRTAPCLTVGWFWFLGVLVPVIGVMRFADFVVADRYSYLPSIGLTLGLAAWVEGSSERVENLRWGAAVVVSSVCIVLTSLALPAWRNSVTLYSSGVRSNPHFMAYNNRGMAYLKQGDLQSALEDFNQALRLNPNLTRAYCNRASVYIDARQYAAAVEDCTRALQRDPSFAPAYSNRGNARAAMGNLTNALADYDRALELSPDSPQFYNNRAGVYFKLKELPRAWADLEKCRALGGRPHPALVHDLSEAMKGSMNTP